jgi:flagellar biogenesis protein FliO
MRYERLIVIALALSATLLTRVGRADAPPASAEPAVTTEPSPMAGLPLRPSKPLSLEPAPTGTSSAGKVALFAVLLAGGLWVWKQRAKKLPTESGGQLRVLRRTTIGVRSELLLLELEGQKLLIGVTPSSMQTLYLLPDTSHDEPVSENAPERRIATLLEARIAPREDVQRPERQEVRELAKTRATALSQPPKDDSILEGQAAGIRSIGSRR